MKQLTQKQIDVLNYIKKHIAEHKFAPTYGDIAKNIGRFPSSVFDSCMSLERKGYLHIVSGVVRGMTLTKNGRNHE